MQGLKRYFVASIFTLSLLNSAWGQKNDCEQTLRTALEEFNAGHFYGLASILKPCIDNGFTKEQRQRAYLLLAQTYLLIDDPANAESSYLELLKANPEFEADEIRDPIDVVYLSKKFTSAPIFSLFVKVGPNISPVRVIHTNDVYQTTDTTVYSKKYFLKPGWQLTIGADLHINEQFSINGGFQFMSSSYQCNYYNSFGKDRGSFLDKQKWLNVPISVKYNINKGKLRPYVFAGFSANLMVSDKANINSLDVLNGGDASQPSSVKDLNILYKRNALNYSFFVGGGIKRKIKLNYVFVDFRYALGLSNIVNSDYLYSAPGGSSKYSSSQEVIFRYGHIDDYLHLDNLAVSIGYIYPLYKPRKLKKAKTKSVMKKIRSQKEVINEK